MKLVDCYKDAIHKGFALGAFNFCNRESFYICNQKSI